MKKHYLNQKLVLKVSFLHLFLSIIVAWFMVSISYAGYDGETIEFSQATNIFIAPGNPGAVIQELELTGVSIPIEHILEGAAVLTSDNEAAALLLLDEGVLIFPVSEIEGRLLLFFSDEADAHQILSENDISIESSSDIYSVFVEDQENIDTVLNVLAVNGGVLDEVDYLRSKIKAYVCTHDDKRTTGKCCTGFACSIFTGYESCNRVLRRCDFSEFLRL